MMYDALTTLAGLHPLVLGSGSPRRKRLLTEIGIAFRQSVSDIEETALPNEDPFAFAIRMAEDKAQAVAEQNANGSELVLGGDTVVVLENRILGKPTDEQNAFDILRSLSGHTHVVGTALALVNPSGCLSSGVEKTTVVFNEVTDDQICKYVASGEPMDKAGAYGIQGMGAFLVDSIEGNLDNVIGLPRNLLNRLAGDALDKLKHVSDCE